MEVTAGSTTPVRGARGASALALTSLALGIFGLLLSVIVIGGILALAGLVLGAWHLRRRTGARKVGWTGVGLSGLALASSVGFAVFYTVILPEWQRSMNRDDGRSENLSGWVGKPAPELEVSLLDGTRWRLSEQRGRRVILSFWATWCGPCVQEVPHFNQLTREIGTEKLAILGVSSEDRAVLKRFSTGTDVLYPTASVLEENVAMPYAEVRRYPTTLVIDAMGHIEQFAEGYREVSALRAMATGTVSGGDGKGVRE